MDDNFFVRLKGRRVSNRFVRRFSYITSLSLFFLFALIVLMLSTEGIPLIREVGLKGVFIDKEWLPTEGKFGLFNFIFASFYTTLLALLFSIPVSILTAIYLSEYLKKKVAMYFKLIFDVLSGVSPVIYGFWGIVVIVPFVRKTIQPICEKLFPIRIFLSDNKSGFSVLSASIVLAIMVSPLIVSISEEVIRAIPFEIRQSTASLGATKWEIIKKVLLKRARGGIFAAIILSFSRSIGETMAVLMVAGCQIKGTPISFFDASYPLPALIANTFGETMSIPLYKSAIFLASLVLLILTLLGNFIGWIILLRIEEEQS